MIGKRWPEVHQALIDQGWTYDGMRRGHHRYTAPNGHTGSRKFVTFAYSASDHRAKLNLISVLRSQGVIVNRNGARKS